MTSPPPSVPPLQDTTPLDVETVTRLYGWTQGRLKTWRRRGKGPPFVRMSERVFVYRRCDIERWILARREHPKAAPRAIDLTVSSTLSTEESR